MATKKAPSKGKSAAKKKAAPKKTQSKAAPKGEGLFYQFRREIMGALCLLLALLIFLSSLDKTSALAKLFMGLVGETGLYVLPLGLVLCSVALFSHGDRPVTMRILCSLSFAFLVSAISHLALNRSQAEWGASVLRLLYLEGKTGASGGVIGGLIAMLFSILGGKIAAWAICILLLLITIPASLNLTLTGLLRAINNHRDELHRKKREEEEEEPYREPAEVLVERVVQHKQARELRRQERRRFDYDLPVDEPERTVKPARAKKPAQPEPDEPWPEPPIKEQTRLETPKPAQRDKRYLVDLPVDEPPLLDKRKPEPEKPVPAAAPQAEPELIPEPDVDPLPAAEQQPAVMPARDLIAPVQPEPAEPELPAPPDKEKVKAADARRAAAQITAQIEQQQELELPTYVYPDVSLLSDVRAGSVDAAAEMRENTKRLQEKLACFNIEAQIVNVTRGPSVTMYELELAQGVRLSRLTGLSDDIALELGASGVRISAIPDKNSMVGIEVPNKTVSPVHIREVIDSAAFRSAKSKISFAVGKDINGNAIVGDIAKMPHILIAGTTGSGKSVCMNSLIISLLFKATPEEVKLIMVDPKMVELGIYNGIPHLLIPVVTDPKKAAGALQWAVTEMMRRYRMMSDSGVREIESYNKLAAQTGEKHMEKIVVVIDELADLMMVAGKEVEESICRIAQMGRAAGVHLVIATQRPSADVITGLMKANIPSRIAFAVSSAMESRIILDTMGAEKLIGRGDMLFAPLGKGKKRVQGCLIEDSEVQAVTDFIKAQGSAEYSDEIQQQIELRAAQSGKNGGSSGSGAQSAPAESDTGDGDELLPAAVEVILETKQASVSMLQRRLKLGYARAARIVDEMEERGIVGPFEGSKPRQLLITKEQWDAMQNGGAAPTQPDAEPVEDLIE